MDKSHSKPCYHKRRKRGTRSLFDKQKNDERYRQQAQKENIPNLPCTISSANDPCTTPLPSSSVIPCTSSLSSSLAIPCTSSLHSSSAITTSLPSSSAITTSLPSFSAITTPLPSVSEILRTTSLPFSLAFPCSSSLPSSSAIPCTSSLPSSSTIPFTSSLPSSSAILCTSSLSSSLAISCSSSLPSSSAIATSLPSSSAITTSLPSSSAITTSLPISPSANLPCTTSLPDKHWQVFVEGNEVQYCKVEKALSGLFSVTSSVIFHDNGSWNVFICDRKVPTTSSVLTRFPNHIPSSDINTTVELVHAVHRALICPGNPEEKFISICVKRGGKVRGERGHGDTVAYIDNTAVIDSHGKSYCCTVRRTDCHIICEYKDIFRECKDIFPVRCKPCSTFRDSMRSTLSRQLKESNENHTSTSSHTCYCNLTSAEKDARLKNLHHSLKVASQQTTALQAKITRLIDAQSLTLQENDTSCITSVIANVTPLVEENFPSNTPQRIFWDQQMLYNSLKNKRQMRWHPFMIRFALNLKYLSTSAYRAARLSGVINLPSERTLVDYTHWSSPHYGVQLEFIEEFRRLLDDVPCEQHHCALSMDEMKIKSGLVFDKHNGTLVGFTDLGSVNRDIELIMSGDGEGTVGGKLANQVFVFLARAVFKPSLSLPVAHYSSLNLKGDQIFPLAWEVIEALEMYNIPVVSLTSDGAKPNRRFYRMCQRKGCGKKMSYKSTNPYSNSINELFFFCDVPHLLKTARNCFSNSFAHSRSRKMQKNGQDISWKWIEHLFLTENSTTTPGVRMCHKLSRDHVWLTSFTRMRVYLAAQVMSQTVASALEVVNRDSTRETRIFIRIIDKFFDCLNVKSPLLAKLKRNDSIAPYSSSTDERFKWLRVDFLSYLREWKDEASLLPGSKKEKQKYCLSRETLEGMKITVSSFTELGPKLLQLPGVKYLLSEVFSQDSTERYFSRQRHRGGSNDNPTAYQVPYSAATLVQQKSVYRDLKTMNVEPEEESPGLLNEPLQKRKRKQQHYINT